MNYCLMGIALVLCTVAPAGHGRTPQIVGVYSSVGDAPIIQFNKDGTKQEIGTAQNTYSLQLDQDGTLRTSNTSTYGKRNTTYCRGVWQFKGDRLYFVIEGILPAGMHADARRLGSMRTSVTKDGIAFRDVVVGPLGAMQLTRTTNADLGASVTDADVAELKPVLARIIGPVPHPSYAGTASEEALKKIVHQAVAAGDVEALMRVTYPMLAEAESDPQFRLYLTYLNCMAFTGTSQVNDTSEAEAQKELAQLKRCCGCTFPDSVSPRGAFMVGRMAKDGSNGSFSTFYYGMVADKWAILGSPYDPKKVGEMRREAHQG